MADLGDFFCFAPAAETIKTPTVIAEVCGLAQGMQLASDSGGC